MTKYIDILKPFSARIANSRKLFIVQNCYNYFHTEMSCTELLYFDVSHFYRPLV